MTELQLKRIRTADELSLYKKIWDDILATEHNDNPFIEYAWFHNWWQIVGQNERVELYIVKKDNEVVAFFPLSVQIKWGVRMYAFTGERIANYSGVVAKKEWMMEAVSFVLDELMKQHRHLLFSFHGLLESGLTSKVMEQYFVERQMKPSIFRVVTPYMAYREVNFQPYFRERQKLHGEDQTERKLRNLGYLNRIAPEQNELWKMFNLFNRQWKKKLDTSGFTVGRKREFFEQLLLVEGNALTVEVDVLVFENQWIAFTYGICCRGRYVTYAKGYEPNFRIFKTNNLLDQETIKRTFSERYNLFDMSIGYESYKFDWRTDIDFTRRMIVSSKSKRTKILHLWVVLKELIKSNERIVEWKTNVLGYWLYLIKYGNIKDWIEYGKRVVEKFIRFERVDLYELTPSNSVMPRQPVGQLFEKMSIQEAMQLDEEEIISLFYKGYIIYKDSFAETSIPAFALHKSSWGVDSLLIEEPLPKETYFLAHDTYKNIGIITAYFQQIEPTKTLWITVKFWQWRKRKRLQKLGYKCISRMKFFKFARFKRKQTEHYRENGGGAYSIH